MSHHHVTVLVLLVGQSVERHVHGTIPSSFLFLSEVVLHVASIVETIVEHMARLSSLPDPVFSQLVAVVGDESESVLVIGVEATKFIISVVVSVNEDQHLEGSQVVEVVHELRGEQDHQERSSIEVSEGELSPDQIAETKTSYEFLLGPGSVESMVGGPEEPLVNSLFEIHTSEGTNHSLDIRVVSLVGTEENFLSSSIEDG